MKTRYIVAIAIVAALIVAALVVAFVMYRKKHEPFFFNTFTGQNMTPTPDMLAAETQPGQMV